GAVPTRPDLQGLVGYHSPQVDVEVRLNTNESPLPPPEMWLDELRAEIGTIDFNRYPDRDAVALRQSLAEFHGTDIDRVFCANGSNEVLQCLLLAVGGPGRRVALFEPTYQLHSHIAKITGTEVVAGRRDDDFGLDLDEVARVLRTAYPVVTFLCSPNNPTGRAEAPDVVADVVRRAPGLVAVDEAYGQFSPHTAVPLAGADGRVVVVRTFSKTWSMAAARLGYAIGPVALVDALYDVALPYHLDSIKQAAGRLALRYRTEMEARVAGIVEERGRIAAALAALPVDAWPSDANFILFRPRTLPADDVWDQLVARSVLVRDCSRWPGLEGCLRVTVGTPAENTTFLAALAEVLA
ncbi:MAG TPA: histidinol-phosphate transaminase, partial [Acidimicrobiales bacterium]|nr:histidinol-phosphate transaminase [Acidimicrobiales bacterium]